MSLSRADCPTATVRHIIRYASLVCGKESLEQRSSTPPSTNLTASPSSQAHLKITPYVFTWVVVVTAVRHGLLTATFWDDSQRLQYGFMTVLSTLGGAFLSSSGQSASSHPALPCSAVPPSSSLTSSRSPPSPAPPRPSHHAPSWTGHLLSRRSLSRKMKREFGWFGIWLSKTKSYSLSDSQPTR